MIWINLFPNEHYKNSNPTKKVKKNVDYLFQLYAQRHRSYPSQSYEKIWKKLFKGISNNKVCI